MPCSSPTKSMSLKNIWLLLGALVLVSVPMASWDQANATSDSPLVFAQAEISEKEAYEAAKELGTIEAWEAFLNNFSEGFRADLARAYLKRLASETPSQPTAGEAQATTAAEKATVPPPPPTPADISLAMVSQGTCSGGQTCTYTVTATNVGGTAFSGQLVIANSVSPRGASLASTGTPPWNCQGMGGGAVCSNYSANIAPGQSSTLPLVFTLPRNAGGQVTSCASIAWGGAPSAGGAADVQRALNNRGFNAGPVDGQPGRRTVNAIRSFQASAGLQQTGEIDLPLLLALFTQGGSGDVNPANDQACAGSAVFSAPPAPAASYTPPRASQYCADGRLRKGGKCVCPSSVPVWTGKTCVPRLARNCTGGRYYSKNRKLCLCPSSKPYWYNNRCHARVDACPGDSVRVGDKCIKENDPALAARPGTSAPQGQAGCGPNSIRIGAVCVNIQQAPVFGGSGQTKQTVTGGGAPSNRQGGGQTTQQAAPAPPPLMKQVLQKERMQAKQKGSGNPCPPGQKPSGPSGPNASSECCPIGQEYIGGGKCRVRQTQRIGCKPGFVVQGSKCVPETITGTRKTGCQPGFVMQGTKCVPASLTATRKTGVACVNGQVVNGRCQCPSNLPRYSKGKCRKADAKFMLKQFTQPQPQQQQPRQNQQQQQQQQIQIPGLGGITISDVRLKRDIEHIATLESGLKIYSYRYLWDETLRVGVMAQDLLDDSEWQAAVVMLEGGYYAVDYDQLRLGID